MFGMNGNASQSLQLSIPALDAPGVFPLPDASTGNTGNAPSLRSPTLIRTNGPAVALGVLNAQPDPFQQNQAHQYQVQQLQMQAQLQPRQNSHQLQLQQQQQQPQQVQQAPQQQLLTTVMQGPHPNPGQGFAYQLPAQASFQPGHPLSIQMQQQRQLQLQQQQQQHQQVSSPIHQHQHQHQLQQAQHQQHQLQLQLQQQQQQHMIHQQQLQLQQQQQQQQLNQQHIPQPHLIRQQSWPAAVSQAQGNIVHAGRDSKALLRLLEFGQNLNSQEVNQSLEVWQFFVDRFYSTGGRQKFSLVNPLTKDIKTFELPVSSLAKCYHINSQSGVKNTKMALETTVEQTRNSPLTLQCVKTAFISDYMNGTKVITTGAIKVVFSSDYKIDSMDFTAVDFVEYIPRPVVDQQADQGLESKTDMKKKGSVKRTPQPKPAQPIPESLVNEFGITSKAMKAFETSDVKSKVDEINQGGDINVLPQARDTAAVQLKSNSTSGVTQPMQSQVANHAGAFLTDGDKMQSSMAPPLDSTKRRFSGGFSQGALGMTFSIPSRSPVLESYATSSHGPNLQQMQTIALHRSPSATGSPLLSPSMKPALPISMAAAVVKGPKRARNSSVASTATSNQARSPVVGNASSSGGARNRKGQGKKELASKRKGSVIEEASVPTSTPGPTLASLSVSTESTGSPVVIENTTLMSRNSASKAIGSPISIPSPTMNPMGVAIPVNGALGDLDSFSGSSSHLGAANGSLGFDSATPNYYAGLKPRQSFIGNMNGYETYSQVADGISGSTGQVEDNEGWTSSLEFISDPKTLDMMGEFIFEGGFDGQDVDSLSGPDTMS